MVPSFSPLVCSTVSHRSCNVLPAVLSENPSCTSFNFDHAIETLQKIVYSALQVGCPCAKLNSDN